MHNCWEEALTTEEKIVGCGVAKNTLFLWVDFFTKSRTEEKLNPLWGTEAAGLESLWEPLPPTTGVWSEKSHQHCAVLHSLLSLHLSFPLVPFLQSRCRLTPFKPLPHSIIVLPSPYIWSTSYPASLNMCPTVHLIAVECWLPLGHSPLPPSIFLHPIFFSIHSLSRAFTASLPVIHLFLGPFFDVLRRCPTLSIGLILPSLGDFCSSMTVLLSGSSWTRINVWLRYSPSAPRWQV